MLRALLMRLFGKTISLQKMIAEATLKFGEGPGGQAAEG
jgi:hypothetical protein